MRLESYVAGGWRACKGKARPLVNPVTDEKLAENDSSGLDMVAAIEHSHATAGPDRAGGGEEPGDLRGLRLHMQDSPEILKGLSSAAAEAAL